MASFAYDINIYYPCKFYLPFLDIRLQEGGIIEQVSAFLYR